MACGLVTVALVGVGVHAVAPLGETPAAAATDEGHDRSGTGGAVIIETTRRDLATVDDKADGFKLEVFDSVTSRYVDATTQTCFRVTIAPSAVGRDDGMSSEGCWDQATVDAGQAWFKSGVESGFVFGVAARGVKSVSVGDINIPVLAGGVWYSRFDGTLDKIVPIGADVDAIVLPQPPV